jgi:hypothetical protein
MTTHDRMRQTPRFPPITAVKSGPLVNVFDWRPFTFPLRSSCAVLCFHRFHLLDNRSHLLDRTVAASVVFFEAVDGVAAFKDPVFDATDFNVY